MFKKYHVLAMTAVATVAVGLAAPAVLTASPARAATPSCGSSCVEPDFLEWGHHQVFDVKGGGPGHVGQEIILWRASHDDGAEDFTYAFQAPVSSLVGDGLLAPATLVHYASDQAFELEYTPFGANSGLCVGTWPLKPGIQVPSTWRLRLFECGVNANTIWIVDHPNSGGNDFGFATIISGTTLKFSHPPVMTYPANRSPFDFPRPDIIVQNQGGFSAGVRPSNQQVGADFGVIP
jgi:hypothetical protein